MTLHFCTVTCIVDDESETFKGGEFQAHEAAKIWAGNKRQQLMADYADDEDYDVNEFSISDDFTYTFDEQDAHEYYTED